MGERWKSIPGYEGLYEVSDHGRVRSLRYGLMRTFTGSHGYQTLTLSVGGVRESVLVHRAVLAAFVGPAPEGADGCHNNGDPSDNRLANLRWDSRSGNNYDKRRHGTDHNVNMTHCPAGHPYQGWNLIVVPARPSARYCRACTYARTTARRSA
ncbi:MULTISPECIES: NUMOD4 motif-containing HNH endonuclease [unclassified Dietzia]|uniref:NUMOD4 motif-containing HNH endonuclease n=1 Tax=unclassified Dietzia TaxID=2617939 RepID=UPI0015F9A46E|nr:NUMOD4 motif-containing HNH endonuclease [Dietzia sp. DQ12-76]MBB1023322.1 hypothetical protein [Dietzia sp. DQ12-76]MBB1026499.1 hypothetical protein [Dietzia sp. DQ11-38-2]